MKLKELAKICKAARTVCLYDDGDGQQWAGTGSTFWKLPENLGRMTPESLCTVFDYTQGQIEKMEISDRPLPPFDLSEFTDGEIELFYSEFNRLILRAIDVLPLIAPGGEVFCVQTRLLSPGKDAEQPSLYLRRIEPAGIPYIVFKEGMFLNGVIVPMLIAPEDATWIGDVCGGITVK